MEIVVRFDDGMQIELDAVGVLASNNNDIDYFVSGDDVPKETSRLTEELQVVLHGYRGKILSSLEGLPVSPALTL